MAKYTRHDARNKKRNKHKQYSKEGYTRKIHNVEGKKRYSEKLNFPVYDTE